MTIRPDYQAPLKDGSGTMSSMVRYFLYASPLIISAAAIAASLTPTLLQPQAIATTPTPAAMPASLPELSGALMEWDSLRRSDSPSFADCANFLLAHPGWPGEGRLRKLAEMRADATASPTLIVSLFTRLPPQSAAGKAAYAEALAATGHDFDARIAARSAWTAGALPPDVEARLLYRFGSSFTPGDHDQRMDRLLAQGSTSAALRQIMLVSPTRRPLFDARIALQTQRVDAATVADSLGVAALADPGFLLDKARWLRDTGQASAARALLAGPLALIRPASDPGRWIDVMLAFARDAASDGQPSFAYGIASNVDKGLPPTLEIRGENFSIRDDYTNLVWLGAQAAQRDLGRPADAVPLYERYARAAQTPQTRTKGWYWAGRAALAAGDKVRANSWFASAAEHGDQFYGQLAAERVGRPTGIILTSSATRLPTPTERASFESSELVKAARWLGTQGRWQDQTLFLRAIAQSVESDGEHVLAAELSRNIGRPDLAVMAARAWRNSSGAAAVQIGFPELSLPAYHQHQWTMIHAIARQESQFDRQIVSQAGARGLMQLMPATAKATADKLGLPFDYDRLTSDPAYNVMLGSAFFAQLLDSFGGNHALAVAAYNAGPGNVRKWIRANGDPRDPGVDIIDWIEKIPISETRGYVQRVLENAVVYDGLNPGGALMPAQNRLSAYLGKNTPG